MEETKHEMHKIPHKVQFEERYPSEYKSSARLWQDLMNVMTPIIK